MKDERYDIVIVGAGHNGTTTASYLAKCGLSVCVLEEKPECGGCQETVEPMAGVRIQPHAIANYAGSAPGWEQLELWRYGFRMDWNPNKPVPFDIEKALLTSKGAQSITQKDMEGWAKIALMEDPMHYRDLMRATFWCPPHPVGTELDENNIPYMQVYKKYAPDMWSKELMEITMFDLMDQHCESEAFKVNAAWVALVSGAHGHQEGVAIPAMACVATVGPPATAKPVGPRGNIHGYYHALFRSAVAHGAIFRTCCPVEEIIIDDGRAIGVRLRDDATWGAKKIWANKAVISATHIKPTFQKLIGPQHLDAGFLQRIDDLSLKGGSLYMTAYLTKEELRFKPQFRKKLPKEIEDYYGDFISPFFPMDDREIYFENVRSVMGDQTLPSFPPERGIFGTVTGQLYDKTNPQCTRPGMHINGPMFMMVPTPQYNADGFDSMDQDRAKWDEFQRKAFSEVCENLDDDNLIRIFSDTPLDQEMRNTGVLGGSWYGLRCDRDQWWNERPLPEMARYRTPIEGLYNAHQSSAHPGGLCLMAVGYNLMHILIEDGIAEPGEWWYPSPWYIPEEGKISAIPR